MSFSDDIRECRREIAKQVKAAKAEVKKEACHAARLNRKAHKAEVKAAKHDQKHQHKLELKETAGRVRSEKKLDKKEFKLENRVLKRAGKIRKASAKDKKKTLAAKQRHQTKMVEKILEQQRNQEFIKGEAKSWIGDTHLLVPILVPLAYRAITVVQRREHSAAARKLGISTDDVARYQGHGVPLLTRIEATHGSLTKLRKLDARGTDSFIRDVSSRPDVAADATSVAEKMAPEQRRRVYHSITVELDSLDRQITSRPDV